MFTASALGLATALAVAIMPLYFVLQNDRDLQRTELGIADLHNAYTDVLNAGDAVIIPTFMLWEDYFLAGGWDTVTKEEGDAMKSKQAKLFPDMNEDTARFKDAVTRLRLFIPANDAALISDLEDSLNPKDLNYTEGGPVPADFYYTEGDPISPIDLLDVYADAKFALVNEFRTDALGQDALDDLEASVMRMQTYSNILEEFEFRKSNTAEETQIGDIEQYQLFKDPRREQK